MSNPCLDIVIVNWNSGTDLSRCLAALATASDASVIRQIIVVDNGSVDRSLEHLPHVQRLVIERIRRNIGFSRACNHGARLGTAPFILFLNPDTEIGNRALTAALDAFARNEASGRIGIVGVRLVDVTGRTLPSCSRFPTALSFTARSVGIDRLPRCRRLAPFMIDWAHDESRLVDQVMGAFFMVRRRLFEDLAGFDEAYPVYYEDLDFAARANAAGYGSWFEVSASVMHRGGGSSRQVLGFRLGLSLIGRWRYVSRHFAFSNKMIVLLVMLAIEPWTRLARALWIGSMQTCLTLYIGYSLLIGELIRPGAIFEAMRRADNYRSSGMADS
jgi:N-acetylglucosaminyl-diphospho-decaprenol L-rhamnosyltransferase